MATNEEIKRRLEEILTEAAKKQNIKNYKLSADTSNNYGDGFSTQFFTGQIEETKTGKITTVAIKISSFFEFDYRIIFENERLFYEKVFPTLDELQKDVPEPFRNLPKYLCGSADPKKEYIAMEHLKPEGFVMFDKEKYLDRDHLQLIFKTYGKFHALSAVLRERDIKTYENLTNGLADLNKTYTDVFEGQLTGAVTAAVNALDHDKDKLVYDVVHDFGKYASATLEKESTYDGKHRCITHGDCWSNNMLFKYSESGKLLDIKLLDFQVCKDSTPVHDLSYFFYSGASKQDFDDLETYLRIYYESFSKFASELGTDPEKLFSFEELLKEWKANAVFGIILGIWLWQVKLTPKEKFKEQKEGDPKLLLDDLLSEMHSNNAFTERTTAILFHAVNYGILTRDKIVRNEA